MSKKKKAAPAPKEVDDEEFDEDDLIAMQKKIAEMEAEAKAAEDELAAAMKETEAPKEEEAPAGGGEGEKPATSTPAEASGEGDKKEEFVKANDDLSVFVKGVDWGATPEELQKHFQPCGPIQRITILVDKFTQRPKGIAYVEFMDNGSKENALLLDDSEFRGRKIQDGAEAASVVEAGVGTVEDMGTVVEGGDSGDAEEEGAGEATTRTTEEAV
eukprot:g5458.t1